jgi:hypothetical protein
MTVPGVNLHTAATFMACVGDIGRFPSPARARLYLGLDPRVRQSGEERVRYDHISKEGAAEARHIVCEAAWIVVRYASPLRAFAERIRARRGAGIATVAVARKLVVLFWHLLTREQDYAFARPTLTRKKLRRLELAAGAPRGSGQPGIWATDKALRQAELELALQAETAYRRLVTDWQPDKGAGATPGRASQARQSGKQRGKVSVPDPALQLVVARATGTVARSGPPVQPNLTYIRRAERECPWHGSDTSLTRPAPEWRFALTARGRDHRTAGVARASDQLSTGRSGSEPSHPSAPPRTISKKSRRPSLSTWISMSWPRGAEAS